MADPLEKALDLIELASDESTSQQERTSAAVKAVRIIRKYKLLSGPLASFANNEFVQAAKTLFGAVTDPKVVQSAKKVRDGVSRIRRR
jgi:hypothetical protein